MDYGSKYADKRERIIALRLQKLYREAQKDLLAQIEQFTSKKEKKSKELLKAIEEGKISEQEYKEWLAGQAFTEKMWKEKVDDLTETMLHTNEKALAIVRDEQLNVFSENANYEAFQIEKDFKGAYSFDIYDESTVNKLVTEKPELLPKRKVNGRKDKAWNQGIISNCVSQGIIQGESIDKIAKRIAHDTASHDMSAMVRYARTAMTSAQNSGRMDTMRRAKDMGINVQKEWMATMDRRTRDSHRKLDGQVRDLDKPFDGELSKIMYPGDPEADPGEVYNCRCTLVYKYPDYQEFDTDWRQNKTIDGDSYLEWKIDKTLAKNGFTFSEVENIITIEWMRKLPTHQKVGEDGRKIIPQPLYNKLIKPIEKAGGKVLRGDKETEDHLRSVGASASTIDDVLMFRKDATISDVLEERCHFFQNKQHLNEKKPYNERECLNEIAAKEYLLVVAEKYKIPPEETEQTRKELEFYKEKLERVKKDESSKK